MPQHSLRCPSVCRHTAELCPCGSQSILRTHSRWLRQQQSAEWRPMPSDCSQGNSIRSTVHLVQTILNTQHRSLVLTISIKSTLPVFISKDGYQYHGTPSMLLTTDTNGWITEKAYSVQESKYYSFLNPAYRNLSLAIPEGFHKRILGQQPRLCWAEKNRLAK